jgi:hypothetical protein
LVICTENGFATNHPADGWLVSPEGRRIVATCRRYAETVIAEYHAKLGEQWTFEPENRPCPTEI